MVGGQVADLENEGGTPTAGLVESIHRRKTGALINASVRVGGLVAGADRAAMDALTRYGRAAGLAFQIADDILDEVSDAATLGKAAGKDRAQGKLTYPRAVGLDAARGTYVDLIEAGIIDPTKVVRTALENAVSVAGVLLLTEATMTDLPEPKHAAEDAHAMA